MSAPLAWALLCGCALGLGLWSLVGMAPALSRPRLVDRVAPYVADISEAAGLHIARRSGEPLPILGALGAPFLGDARSALSRVLGGSESVALRLRQAASGISVERMRAEQLVWGLLGFVVGAAVAVVSGSTGTVPLAGRLALPVVGLMLGILARDAVARRAASRRLERITEELPTVLEFLTLSLSAGEGITEALRRVSRASSGELAGELGGVIARVNSGTPLGAALEELGTAIRLPALSRAIDQITIALERGTPLAAVLRAQAQDARAQARNRLLESAGRKEVAMLVPLVFLILPLTVVMAIFPGLFVLQTGF